MKPLYFVCAGMLLVSSVLIATSWADGDPTLKTASPIYGVTIPDGYRQWELIAPAIEATPVSEICAVVGNKVAIYAYP